MPKRKRKKIDNETVFEDHFCHQLDVVGKYRVRSGSKINIDKAVCIFFDDLEDFLDRTQEEKFRKVKFQLGAKWKEHIASQFRIELQSKRLFQILKDGISVQGIDLDLIYFYPERAGNVHQRQLAEKNRFTAVRQYYFGKEEERKDKSIDIVLMLNGFAVVTIELKNEGTSGDVEVAVQQYLDRPLDLPIFTQPFLHLAVGNEAAKMATVFSVPPNEQNFRDFNKELVNIAPNSKEYPIHYLYHETLLPESLLNYIETYLYIKDEEDRKWIFPRFHQQRATRLVVNDLKDHFEKTQELDRRYLIQHSTGSGKSNTILWMAQNLRNAYVGESPLFTSIIILTDRINLDEQIGKDFQKAILANGVAVYAEKTPDLEKALKENKKIIVSTIHKFSYLKEVADQSHKRICVLIDEAHRSQSGKYHDAVTDTFESDANGIEPNLPDVQEKLIEDIARKKFPNMAFIALTATPSPKTLEHFGKKLYNKESKKDEHVPHDVYTMEQAIAEDYIEDVAKNIYAYDTLFKLNKQVDSSKGYLPMQVRKALRKKAYEHSEIIKEKCRMMLEIFKNESAHKMNGKSKAMIVTSSRLAAVKYKLFLDEIVEEQDLNYQSLIAFSGKIKYEENIFTEREMNKTLNPKNQKLEDVFEKGAQIRFLIVANKFQTGYDEPQLHTMFLDKPLRGRNAVQTLSRLNRKHPDKKDTLAVDFTGSYEQIMKAYKYYQKTVVTDKTTDPNDLFKIKEELLKFGVFTISDVDDSVKLIESEDERFMPAVAGQMFLLKNKYKEHLSEQQREVFRTLARRYTASFSYIKSLYFIKQKELWDFQLFLLYLNNKLTDSDFNSLKKEIADVVVTNFAVSKLNKVKEPGDDDDEDTSGGGGRGGNSNPTNVRIKKTVKEVIEEINLKFLAELGGEGTEIIGEFISLVVTNAELKEIIRNNSNQNKEDVYQNIIREKLQTSFQDFVMDGILEERYSPEVYDKIVNENVMPHVNRMAYNYMLGQLYV